MSIDWKQQAQLYKITYKNDGRCYIGITWGKNHSYLKRFNKHMNCNGSVHIKNLIKNGATKEDFYVELIEENELDFLHEKEKELSVLWPEGLNGNKGNFIIQSEEGKQKANEKRKEYWSVDNRIKHSMKCGNCTYDESLKNIKERDFKKMLTKEEKERIIYERNRKIALNHLNSEESKAKRKISRENISEEDKEKSNKKRSDSMKKYRKTEGKEKKQQRLEKYKEKMTTEKQRERAEKISESKKGKSTNQQKIMQTKYKNMSDVEFFEYIKDWNKICKSRAINLRNKEDIE